MKKRRYLLSVTLVLLLCACSSLGGGSKLGPSLTAVNYTDWPFDWVGVATVEEPDKAMAAEGVEAFGASGIMCCVSLPARWQPGMQLVVQTIDGTRAKNSAEWDKEKLPLILHRVDVPPYKPEDAGTVWVQLLPGGKVKLVVSSYSPNHALWPGEVKGWPVPTVEYRRKIWDRDMDHLKRSLLRFENAIKHKTGEDAAKFQEGIDIVKRQIQLLGQRP